MTANVDSLLTTISSDTSFEEALRMEVEKQINGLNERLLIHFYVDNNGTRSFKASCTNIGQTENYFKEALQLGTELLESLEIDNELADSSKNLVLIKEAARDRTNIIQYLIKVHSDIALFKVALKEIPKKYTNPSISEEERSLAKLGKAIFMEKISSLRALPLTGWDDGTSINTYPTIVGWKNVLAEFEDDLFCNTRDIQVIRKNIEDLRKAIGIQNHAEFLKLFKAEKEKTPPKPTLHSFQAAAKQFAIEKLSAKVKACLDATTRALEKMTEINKAKISFDGCKKDKLGLQSFYRHKKKAFFTQLALCLSILLLSVPAIWITVKMHSSRNLTLAAPITIGIGSVLFVIALICFVVWSHKSKIRKNFESIIQTEEENVSKTLQSTLPPDQLNISVSTNNNQIDAQNALSDFVQHYKSYGKDGLINFNDKIRPDNHLEIILNSLGHADNASPEVSFQLVKKAVIENTKIARESIQKSISAGSVDTGIQTSNDQTPIIKLEFHRVRLLNGETTLNT